MLAVPVLAASGVVGLMGLLNKNWRLDRKPSKAPAFYSLLGAGMVLGTVLAVIDTNPIGLLVLSAVVNATTAGPFLIIMMLISRDRKIMGKYRNRALSTILGWATTAVMCVAGVYGIWFTVTGG